VALFRALKAVALKVNSLPFKVNLLASSPSIISKTSNIVTVIDPNTVNTNAAKLSSVEDDNTKATARAVRNTQPVGIEYTIDKAVGLTIGKTNLNTTYKTIGAKTALLLVFMTNMR
jgi:hypothetical protein